MDNAGYVQELLEFGKIPQEINLNIDTKCVKQKK